MASTPNISPGVTAGAPGAVPRFHFQTEEIIHTVPIAPPMAQRSDQKGTVILFIRFINATDISSIIQSPLAVMTFLRTGSISITTALLTLSPFLTE
jgi:hypothetical protein